MSFALAMLLFASAPAAPIWQAPEGCPAVRDVEHSLQRLLLAPDVEPVTWHGRVEQVDAGFRLELVVGLEVRVLEEPTCEALADAAALIVAVASDPVAVAVAVQTRSEDPEEQMADAAIDPTPPPPTPAPPSPSARPPAPAPLVSTTPRRDLGPRSLQGRIGLATGAELGVLPRAGLAFAVEGGLGGPRWRAELVALTSLPRRQFLAERRDRGARAMVFAGQARGCGVLGRDRVLVPLCAALEVGGVWARGFGPEIIPRSRTQPWAAAVPSVAIDVMLSARWSLSAKVAAPIALYQPATRLDGVGHVFRAGEIGARLWIGPALHFP